MSSNVYINALAGTSMFEAGRDRNITYYFDNTGSRAWTSEEKAGMRAAMQSWADVANITFKEVQTRAAADISELLWSRDLMGILVDPRVTAFHYYPDKNLEVFEGVFSITGSLDDNAFNLDRYSVIAGTRNLQIFTHEIGHALGLTHPHDTDLGTNVFPGVTGQKSTGAFGLNQNIYTVMSYNDFANPSPTSGYAAGPMAFDIAAIQSLYGANTNFHSGNDTYTLSSSASGNYWKCLWDTGGTDEIKYVGSANTVIDLREATLIPGPGAGGFISRAGAAKGGVTIAKGVTIENASGGSGNDTITGNAAANILAGNAGADTLSGGAGRDKLYGGAGSDILSGGLGRDLLYGGTKDTPNDFVRDVFNFDAIGESRGTISERDIIFGFRTGIDIIDLATIDANIRAAGNQAFKFIGDSAFHSIAGELRVNSWLGVTSVAADVNGDGIADFAITVLASKVAISDFVL